MLFYVLQTIVVTTILLTHTLSYPAEHKKEAAPDVEITDAYRRARTTELETALTKSKKEEHAAIIKQHVEKYGIRAFWGMPLREAIQLKDRELVRYLIEQRANISHGKWGEKIARPLYRPGYIEETTLELAGDDQELLKILQLQS